MCNVCVHSKCAVPVYRMLVRNVVQYCNVCVKQIKMFNCCACIAPCV